jgi:hypothetical protein
MGDVHKITNFYLYNDLFPCRDGRISIPLYLSCSGKFNESSFCISPDEFNANSISNIKIFIIGEGEDKGIMAENAEFNARKG